jgi:hypothetical protein
LLTGFFAALGDERRREGDDDMLGGYLLGSCSAEALCIRLFGG